MPTAKQVLPIIIFSQFAGTSLWFAGNAIIGNIGFLDLGNIGWITSAVQVGFISGTLIFALLLIADRYRPTHVFFWCSILASLANVSLLLFPKGFYFLLTVRFITGFFLAGIYPVGMKIAADWHQRGLGKALGYLVGALVLGTAFPHLIADLHSQVSWRGVVMATSLLAASGGFSMLLGVSEGPYRKPVNHLDFGLIKMIFINKDLRSAAFGYFGHMWELYAFWAFLPVVITAHGAGWNHVSTITFLCIAVGSVSCVVGGYGALRFGSSGVAFWSIVLSGLCCLTSPLAFNLPSELFVPFLIFWGMAVVADSPQFSTLVASKADPSTVGTALTLTNCIGFGITIVSIQLLTIATQWIDPRYLFLLLVPGPLFGAVSVYRIFRPEVKDDPTESRRG